MDARTPVVAVPVDFRFLSPAPPTPGSPTRLLIHPFACILLRALLASLPLGPQLLFPGRLLARIDWEADSTQIVVGSGYSCR